MTERLNLPAGEEYLKSFEDPVLREHYETLEESPNFQSFKSFKWRYNKLLKEKPYLEEMYPREVLLQHVSDLLVSYKGKPIKQVSEALEKDNDTAEKIQAAAEAFLKWYWSEDLNDPILSATLEGHRNATRIEIAQIDPQLSNEIIAENDTSIIPYIEGFLSHQALEEFKNYLDNFDEEQITNMLKEETDMFGNTALHFLTHKGSVELAQLFPEAALEAIVNKKNASGDTALHTAIKQGNTEFALMLLAMPDIHFENENKAGKTPLSLAAQKQNYQVTLAILRKKGTKLLTRLW